MLENQTASENPGAAGLRLFCLVCHGAFHRLQISASIHFMLCAGESLLSGFYCRNDRLISGDFFGIASISLFKLAR